MPLYFWGDDDGERYRESYFDMYPGVWRHGDWIEITPRGTGVIYGRSDSTINRGGVRMGTSEIYRAVLAVWTRSSTRWSSTSRGRGRGVDAAVRRACARASSSTTTSCSGSGGRIREDCSPRHVPDEVRAIDEVPRTLSGKVLEIPVKKILMGTAPDTAASRESLANPESLEYFIELAGSREA